MEYEILNLKGRLFWPIPKLSPCNSSYVGLETSFQRSVFHDTLQNTHKSRTNWLWKKKQKTKTTGLLKSLHVWIGKFHFPQGNREE